MRCKIVHGIDDNENISTFLCYNEKLSEDDHYKLSEDDFCGRWLALKPHCKDHERSGSIILKSCPQECSKSWEKYTPCINCIYYGEFVTIDDSFINGMGVKEPPIVECVKRCANCVAYGGIESDDSEPDSVS